MYSIIQSRTLAPNIQRIEIQAPLIAEKRKAGQFVVLRIDQHGERIPLTLLDSDPVAGTISLVVQGVGKTTQRLNQLKPGDAIEDVVGPLGKPSEIENFGTVVVIGGGVGTGVSYPTAAALKAAGNHVISITGARTHEMVILEEELKQISDEVYVTTDDGSYGFHGFVTQKLQELIDAGRKIDIVYAVGPIPMMRAVSDLTRRYDIPTIVSLNPIMVDGIGMCGGCRATVDHKPVFVCVDGPEFDGHKVDFEGLTKRNRSYVRFEKKPVDHDCKLDAEVERTRSNSSPA